MLPSAVRGLLLSCALVVGLAAPVAAQYEPSPTTTPAPPTTAEPPPTTEPQEPQPTPPSTEAPPSPIVVLPPLEDAVEAGGTLTVAGPRGVEFPPEAADDARVVLSTVGAEQLNLGAEATVTVVDGRLVVSVVVPADTAEQILVLTIVATDVDGVLRTFVVLVPVRQPPPGDTGEPEDGAVAAGVPSAGVRGAGVRADSTPSLADLELADLPQARLADVPAVVRALQASVPDDATEQELLDRLARDPGSELIIDDGRLLVSTRPAEGVAASTVTPVATAAAVILGCIGMASFRRRRAPARRRTHR